MTKREGRVRAPMDLLIGSHALSIDAVPVTNDRAFRQRPSLSIQDWTEASQQRKGHVLALSVITFLHDKYPYHVAKNG